MAACSNPASTLASPDPLHWRRGVVGGDPTTAFLLEDKEAARLGTGMVASPCKGAAERSARKTILLLEPRRCTTPEMTVEDTVAETEVR